MLSKEQQKKMDAMLAKQAEEFKDLSKQLKLNGNDEDDDPEMRELNKQLKKRGNFTLLITFKIEALANAPDDQEVDEDELLAELSGLDSEELEAAKIYVG